MISAEQLDALDPQTRQAMLTLLAEVRAKEELIAQRDREAAFKQALIDKLTHEMVVLKRLKFAATSERFAEWAKEATAPFASYRISVPTRAELARDAWARRGERPSPIAWHLTAAEDWSL